MKTFSRLFVLAALTLFCAGARAAVPSDFCSGDSSPLRPLIMGKTHQRVIALIQAGLMDAYEKAGIAISPNAIVVTPSTSMFLSFVYSTRATAAGKVTNFSSELHFFTSDYLLDVTQTDNAVYDSLGNLVTPATKVSCEGFGEFEKQVTTVNAATGRVVFAADLPSDRNENITSSVEGSTTSPAQR